MTIDPADLSATAARAGAGYPHNVRGRMFIDEFEGYVEREFGRHGLVPLRMAVGPFGRETIELATARGRYVLGGYYAKELDVGYYASNAGPLVGVSLKSMMSSIGQNVNNRWEETVGDAANLHGRYPMLVFGYLMVVPYVGYRTEERGGVRERVPEAIIDAATGGPTDLALRLERRLRSIAGRDEPTSLHGEFEEVALAVIDFRPRAPLLHPTFPAPASGMRLDDYFERLTRRFRDRNPNVPL